MTISSVIQDSVCPRYITITVRVMAWHRTGDEPIDLKKIWGCSLTLTHLNIIRLPWFNTWTPENRTQCVSFEVSREIVGHFEWCLLNETLVPDGDSRVISLYSILCLLMAYTPRLFIPYTCIYLWYCTVSISSPHIMCICCDNITFCCYRKFNNLTLKMSWYFARSLPLWKSAPSNSLSSNSRCRPVV